MVEIWVRVRVGVEMVRVRDRARIGLGGDVAWEAE